MSVKTDYEDLKSKVIERKKDFEDFINFLENKTTWLTAPASVSYHLSEETGLLKHSVGVAKTLLKLRELLAPELSEESCVIVSLFHDVGKIGMPDNPRYLKKGDKFVYNKDQVEMQIANRSLYLVSKYIPLSDEESQAILYHDGQYIPENWFIAHKECPLTLLLTFADTWTAAVYEEGREIEENTNYYKRSQL
jgi:23S rRNA maturation-related 3'-5' exoribonuclease YhaM